jgi:hypothetical protein
VDDDVRVRLRSQKEMRGQIGDDINVWEAFR